MRYSIRRSSLVSGLGPFSLALAMGVLAAFLVLVLAPTIPGWSRYKLVLVGMLGLAYLGALMVGELRRVLLVSIVLAIPLNLSFSPLGDVLYHAGGAPAGVVLYLYDFPLIGLLILSLLDTLARRRLIHFSSIDLAAVLLILWTVLSIVNSSQIELSVFEVIRMAKLYLLARVIAGNVRGERGLRDVLAALFIGLVLQGVIVVFQYTTGNDLGLGFFTVGELRRVSGTIGWPNTLGAYTAAIFCIGLCLWVFHADGRLRVLARAACLVGIVPLVLSYSRGAWVAMLVGVTIGILLGWRAGWLGASSFISLGSLALSFAIVSAFFGNSILARLGEVATGMEVLAARSDLNGIALNMIGAHPVLGVGINTFVDVIARYDPTGVASRLPYPVHNVFLLVAAETGLGGLGFFLLLVLAVFREGLQVVKSHDRFLAVCATGIVSAVSVLMVSNLADDHLRTGVLYALFWLLIGLVVAVRRMQALDRPSWGMARMRRLPHDSVPAIIPGSRLQH